MIAARITAEFQDGWIANLGVGMPTMCSDFLPADKFIILHSENGLIGYGRAATVEEATPYVVNAGVLASAAARLRRDRAPLGRVRRHPQRPPRCCRARRLRSRRQRRLRELEDGRRARRRRHRRRHGPRVVRPAHLHHDGAPDPRRPPALLNNAPCRSRHAASSSS